MPVALSAKGELYAGGASHSLVGFLGVDTDHGGFGTPSASWIMCQAMYTNSGLVSRGVLALRACSFATRSLVKSSQVWTPVTPAPSTTTLLRCQSRPWRGAAVPLAPTEWLYASTAAL